MEIADLNALKAELLRAARAGEPCPSQYALGCAVCLSRHWVAKALALLEERGRIEIEHRSRVLRRVRVLDVNRWSPWTGWTVTTPILAGDRFINPALNRRGEIVAKVERLERAPMVGASRTRIETLLGQGYSPATVARLAGLRPHEADLVRS